MNPYVERIRAYAEANQGDLKQFVDLGHPSCAEALDKYINKLVAAKPVAPAWRDPEGVFPQNDQVFTCQEFYRNAINYCYVDPATGQKFKVGNLTGSMAMGHCFFRHFGDEFIDPQDILDLTDTPGALEKFFAGETPMPLMEERRLCLREAAIVLRDRYNGRPANIFVEAGFRITRDDPDGPWGIVEHLMERFPLAYGQDKVTVDGETLVFAKRPYLWPLVYQGRAMEKGSVLQKLLDPERIGPVVDYQIPNALRHLGIIRYSDELARKIDSKTPIGKGSQEELAIRLATVLVLDTIIGMTYAFRDEEPRWTMVELDYELWMMGRAAAKAGLQHHLTLTTDY